MRVSVRDDRNRFSPQTHAYAEYRAFSSVAGMHRSVDDITVTLTRRRPGGPGGDMRVACTIAVRLASGDVAEARALADHACAAIDRAAFLIRHAPPLAAGSLQDGGVSRRDRAPLQDETTVSG